MAADTPPNVHVIDYAYSSNGVFYHGTISNLDGVPKSTRTISVGDKKTHLDDAIDQTTFDYLWSGLATLAVFKRSTVIDANTKMDFYHFQVIAAVDAQSGKSVLRTYLVSPSEVDRGYHEWIKKLNVPFEKSGH